eukprot:6214697-Pleurochrysis_carterae.AAC.1
MANHLFKVHPVAASVKLAAPGVIIWLIISRSTARSCRWPPIKDSRMDYQRARKDVRRPFCVSLFAGTYRGATAKGRELQ